MGFYYEAQRLHCDGVDLQDIAESHGTPVYVYSQRVLERNAQVIEDIFIQRGIKASYAMKANASPAILKLFREKGLGADIVSGGELQMALRAGYRGNEINFAGVGKTLEELDQALQSGIEHFNVESMFELELLDERAGVLGVKAPVLLRLNPDIDPQTHPHISTGLKKNKFGMSPEAVEQVLSQPSKYPHVLLDGIHCHIGSQILQPQPFNELIDYLTVFTKGLRSQGISISHIDLGGGFGVNYHDAFEDILKTTPFLEAIAEKAVSQLGDHQLHIQPGRVLVANAGLLLTRVQGIKENGGHHFVVVDAATTELIRPALYSAYHAVYAHQQTEQTCVGDVVGPVCESSDALARERDLPDFQRGDLMAIGSAGAYASSMGSTYNLRPLAPEVMVTYDGEVILLRRRQTFQEMIALYT